MQASIFPPQWNLIQNIIHEGNLYVLTNFIVVQATGWLRSVSSNVKIIFMGAMIVEALPLPDAIIPMHKFEFTCLEDLYHLTLSYTGHNSPVYATGQILKI